MKCLIKYKWVKLPRDLEIDAKGLMTYYIRLVTRAAFRKGTARYCGFENHVEPGMWAGGIVGLKSILGVKKRLLALWIMNQLEDLGYLTWTLEPKTKLLTYKITDWVTKCSGAPCKEGAVYASTGYGFIGIPRNITQRLVDGGYKFEPGDAFLDLWCHTVYRDYGNAFSFLAPDVQYEKYGSVLTLEMLGKRWGWEKTKVCRFFKKYEEYFRLYRLPASYGCVIFNQCYPTEDRVTIPSQEQVVSIFKEILIRARNTHTEGTRNEKLNRFVAWLSRRLMKAWEESVLNQSDSETEAENQSGIGVLKASVAFLAPIIRAYISHGRNCKHGRNCINDCQGKLIGKPEKSENPQIGAVRPIKPINLFSLPNPFLTNDWRMYYGTVLFPDPTG